MLKRWMALGISALEKLRSNKPKLHQQFDAVLHNYVHLSSTVLDAGCGKRDRAASELAKIIGVDINKESASNPDVDEFVCANLFSLPFKNKCFDAVTCYETIEHLSAPIKCFKEFYRVCKDGSTVIIVTPNTLHYANFIVKIMPSALKEWFCKYILATENRPHPTFFRANTPYRLKNMMEQVGFKAIEMRYIDSGPLYLDWLVPLYALGIVYHRFVNFSDRFSFLRSDIIAVFYRCAGTYAD